MKLESGAVSEHIKQENFKHPCLVQDSSRVIYLTGCSISSSVNDINNQIESDAIIIGGPINAHIGFFVTELNLQECIPYYGSVKLTQSKG